MWPDSTPDPGRGHFAVQEQEGLQETREGMGCAVELTARARGRAAAGGSVARQTD